MAKWNTTAGPVQTKRVAEALKSLMQLSNTWIELTGVHGQPDTEHRHSYYSPMSPPPVPHPLFPKIMEDIGNQYAWTITSDNHAALIDEVKAATMSAQSQIPVVDKRITAEEDAARKKAVEDRRRQEAETTAKYQTMFDKVMAKKPATACALIVAELIEDQSDSMTDYFASKVVKTVAIGWRSGKREDFRQLREAARSFPETAHLADGDDKVEHRDNYSMGAGNYLKAGWQHSNGWKVRSIGLDRSFIRVDEDRVPELKAGVQPVALSADGGITISENFEKNGIEIRFPAKPDRRVIDNLKGNGWRWSPSGGCWYRKQSPEARAFANAIAGRSEAALAHA